ncbi:MAG: LCCL domain-containing protein [Sphaerochaeta sp.]|nr:LCCL domain-containing protein [Sphaerochaeta sp.]
MNHTRLISVLLMLIALLVGCTSGALEIGPGGPNLFLEYSKQSSNGEIEEEEVADKLDLEQPTLIAWERNAEDFSNRVGDTITLSLPAHGYPAGVWGVGIYTTDSSIGTAAVHMGLITFGKGGTVTIEVTEGRQNYGGLLINGVSSTSYGSWPLSFVFLDKNGRPIGTEALEPIEISYLSTAVDLGLEPGEKMRVRIPPNSPAQDVFGSDPYTFDSSIASAAAHKGLISLTQGGVVSVRMLEKRQAFIGNDRNDIYSYDYEGALEAFTLE